MTLPPDPNAIQQTLPMTTGLDFETFPLSEGASVYRFDTGPFNWYVIEEAGRITLVDAGFPRHYNVFRRGLMAIGRQLQDVEAIILTHAHADHMGFIERLRRETGAPVYVHEADAKAAQRQLQLPWATLLINAWHPYVAGMLTHATRNGIFVMPPIARVQTVTDGVRLDVPGRPTIIHTPGHTPGQIVLRLAATSIILAGDALITRNILRGTGDTPQLAASGLNSCSHQAQRSLNQLAGMGRVALLTGHGPAWRGDMDEAIAGARTRSATSTVKGRHRHV